MAPNPKVLKAFSAMKSLGIPAETVKPVLKNLLQLYDKNWELIEEDNYRTLADAIFESADDKQREGRNDSTVIHSSEPPLKKLHLAVHGGQVPSTMDNQGTKIRPKLMESSHKGLREPKTESSSDWLHKPFRDKGKVPISSDFPPKERKLSSEKMTEDHHEEGFMKTKMKQPITDLPHFAVPTSMGHSVVSDSLEGSSTGNKSTKYLMSENAENENKDEGSACNYRKRCQSSFDIASSPFGEVKISLKCNSTHEQPKLHAPNLDEVLKFVENKYIRSYKIVGPQFSVIKLLKELCESYLELGTYSKSDLNKKESSCSVSSSTSSLVIVPEQPTTHHNISDITKGTEKVVIPLLSENGNEHIPNFTYMPQNIIYQDAYVHFSLARISDENCCSSCLGDCLSSSVPCACARETKGEFAYTPQGLLKEEFLRACISMNQEPRKHDQFYCQGCPLERAKNGYRPELCKGHLVRKFIKECWRKCGCNMQCGNRVVQRGITRNLQLYLTDAGKGWGLRTLEELPKGAFVCEYVGEILTNMELYERNKRSSGNDRHTYPVLLDADWGSEQVLRDEDALCLDATYYGNVGRFINHRCFDANLLEIPVEVETPDHHYYHLAFFTKRKVGAFEELTWDYGIDFEDHNHPIKAFQCCCGSDFCRDTKKQGMHEELLPVYVLEIFGSDLFWFPIFYFQKNGNGNQTHFQFSFLGKKNENVKQKLQYYHMGP